MGEDDESGPAGFRSRHKAKRRAEFLAIARHIISTESESALTMQRLTDEVGGSVGSVYYYFPNRAALLDALEVEALETVAMAFVHAQANLEAVLDRHDPDDAQARSLVRLLAHSRIWVAVIVSLPTETEVLRRVLRGFSPHEGADWSFLPASAGLAGAVEGWVDVAVSIGALRPGDSPERALMLTAATFGGLIADAFGLRDGPTSPLTHMSTRLTRELLRAWGAEEATLARAIALLDGISADALAGSAVDRA